MTLLDSATRSVPALAETTETGALGIYHLKRLWSRIMATHGGSPDRPSQHDRQLDNLVIHALGLGLEQTLDYLGRQTPTFANFERWIVATSGIDPAQIARINAAVTGAPYPDAIKHWLTEVDAGAPVLTADDLAFWNEHGYVVVHDAVAGDTRDAAAEAVWTHLGASADDPQSWYQRRDHGIMVQYFQHPAFAANRRSPRIHKAFAQLWGTADLWVTTDRVGFNVPERPDFLFPGPDLHWDASGKCHCCSARKASSI